MFLSGCKKNGEDSKGEDKAKENDLPKPKSADNRKTVFPVKTQKDKPLSHFPPQATLKANQPLPKLH